MMSMGSQSSKLHWQQIYGMISPTAHYRSSEELVLRRLTHIIDVTGKNFHKITETGFVNAKSLKLE